MKNLIKYTEANNLTITSSENARTDTRVPYSFLEWIERSTGIASGKEIIQYGIYLKNWYEERSQQSEDQAERTKDGYIALLQQINLTLLTEEEQKWAQNINWDNNLEVAQVIPFYAKKLKEIGIYLINKREAIKRAKLKYNLVGSSNALEKLFYEYLLKAFTKRKFPGNEYLTNVTEVSVLCALPELLSVTPDFSIEIEELYDDTMYLDRDPNIESSEYFDLTTSSMNVLLSGYTADELNWLYNTGNVSLCADHPMIFALNDIYEIYDSLPLSAKNTFDGDIIENLFVLLTQKYIGTDQFIISGGYYIPWIKTVNIPLVTGNNWFYWVSGEFLFDVNYEDIDPILLTESNLISSGATAHTSYLSADRIFVSQNNSVSGAWLKQFNNSTYNEIMSARLLEGNTIFSFPYPGYGLSGADIDWQGRQLDNINDGYNLLEETIKKDVLKKYWSTTLDSEYSITPIYIYDTTLIDCNAIASKTYKDADKIIVRNTAQDITIDGVYTDQQQYAWLYDMTETDIPVGYGENKIYWPFERISDEITMIATSGQCESLKLSEINIAYFKGSIAGSEISNSDTIKKLASINGDVIEMAWLSGVNLSTPTFSTNQKLVSGVAQPSLSFLAMPGTENSFIFESTLSAYADNIFSYIEHNTGCKYLTQDLISLYNEVLEQDKDEIDYNQWKQCNCKAIVYSPFGHPGSKFDDYNRLSDYIIAIENPNETFNLKDWRDSSGLSYLNSMDFGWYQLSSNRLEPDAGWGRGTWITNTGQRFILKSNKVYLYFRSNINRDIDITLDELDAPYFVMNYSYNNNKQKWIKCSNSINGWVSEDIASDMIINPGDYIIYDHQDTYSYYLTSCSCTVCPTEAIIGLSTIFISPSIINNKFSLNAVNFKLNIPFNSCKPYWAVATDIPDENTKNKLIDVWGGYPIEVDYYNFKYQPEISKIKLTGDCFIQYTHVSSVPFNWIQSVEFNHEEIWNQWCKIDIQYNSLTAGLSSNLFEIINVSATDIESDIILYSAEDNPMLVNYYAISGFTWAQSLSNTTLGLPPTGGTWVPITSADLIAAEFPYINILNRHYPTFAAMPYTAALYTEKDVGGYFLPQYIGLTQAINKNKKYQLETRGLLSTSNDKRGYQNVYRDPNIFSTDIGLTKTTQIVPVSSLEYNSLWMKAGITEQYKAGIIIDTDKYQTFCPYQTKFESLKYNTNGIRRQDDKYTPWGGRYDNDWENKVDWPANWRGQYNIEGWYEQNDIPVKQIYQWKTDIFGNQYALYKDMNGLSIYDKSLQYGEIWIRDGRNRILNAVDSLADIYEQFYALTLNSAPIQGTVEYNILSAMRDFDIWYDTIMLYTTGYLLFNKIEFDYDENRIYSLADNLNYICLGDDTKFGGIWFNEEEKQTTICTVVSGGAGYWYPILYQLDLNDNTLFKIYNGVDVTEFRSVTSSIIFREIEEPVLTYNIDKSIYNVSFIGYGFSESTTLSSGMILATIDIKNDGTKYNLLSATYLTPVYIDTNITY